jgi:hypothetical protein
MGSAVCPPIEMHPTALKETQDAVCPPSPNLFIVMMAIRICGMDYFVQFFSRQIHSGL